MALTNIQNRALISLQKGLRKILLHGSSAAVFRHRRTGKLDINQRPVEVRSDRDRVTGKVANILRSKGLLGGINKQAKIHNRNIIASYESAKGLKDYYKSKRQVYKNFKSLTKTLKPELLKAATDLAVVRAKRHNTLRRQRRKR